MIGMLGKHLLVKMNCAYNVHKNSNDIDLSPSTNYFKKKRNDEVGLYGNEPSTQIRINKGISIPPIYQILSS